jgi:PAS domain S-box-containing protein
MGRGSSRDLKTQAGQGHGRGSQPAPGAGTSPSEGRGTESGGTSRSEHALQRAALAVSQARGPRVYEELIAELADILEVDVAFVAVFDDVEGTHMRTLAAWLDGRLLSNFSYALAGTPCARVVGREFRYVAQGISAEFEPGSLFAAKGMDCYAAYPLFDASGGSLGLLVTLNRIAVGDPVLAESMLKIFAVRMSAEIERERSEDVLRRAAVAVSSAEGAGVYRELVRVLAAVLGVEIAYIAQPRSEHPSTLTTLSLSKDGDIVDNVEYEMTVATRERLLRSEQRIFTDLPDDLVPGNRAFAAMGASSQMGLPLTGSDGAWLGVIAVASRKPLPNVDLVESMLKIFAARVRTEIERSRAETALRASEVQYRAIFDASADALVLWDSTPRRVDVNPAYERIHGFTREEVLRSEYRAGMPAEYAELRRELVQRTLAGTPCAVELETMHKNGQRIEVEVRTIPVQFHGEPHVLAIIRDVTERKRMEAAARASEEQYREIFNASVDGMALWDDSGRIADVNPAFVEMHGFDRGDFEGADCSAFIPEDGREACMRLVRLALAGERSQGEHVTRHKSGLLRSMEIRAIPVRYRGRPHALTLVRDITDRKRTEEALRGSAAQYRAMFDAWEDALVLRDADFRIIDVNTTYERFTGRRREDVLGLDRVVANPPGVDERVKAMHGRALAGESIQLETQLLNVNDTQRDLELRGVPIRHQGEPHVLYIGRDITARKRAEAERAILEAQLRQSQKMEAIGQLTGGIAHDFNNILQGVIGYLVLAKECNGAMHDPRLSRYLDRVHAAAQRAGNLIRQMLTFSRGQRGERLPLRLAPLVHEATQMLRSTLPSTIELRATLDDDVPAILVDPIQFEQVLLNLSINARDAMNNVGDIEVATRIVAITNAVCTSCRQRVSGTFVELAVRDSGPGIPLHVIERMFEPFYTTKDVGKGSGMGLAMVHGIVHDHGAHILVDSAMGEGTTMRVVFPPVPADSTPPREGNGTRPEARRDVGLEGRVLVAEDAEDVRELLFDLLTDWGLEVTLAATGAEALALFETDAWRFDLMLTDLTMPGMTGVALARAITRMRPGMPVLLCTGYSDDLRDDDITSAGIHAVLRKPFEPADLHASVKRLIAPRPAPPS